MPVLDRNSAGFTTSTAPADAAGRIWTRLSGDKPTPEQVVAGAERIASQLRGGLGRWIGSEGYRTLLERALAVAQANHPALGGLSVLDGDKTATAAAAEKYGADVLAAGMVALITVLIDLLGGIIGGEMALRLVEQVAIPSPRVVENHKTQVGGGDG